MRSGGAARPIWMRRFLVGVTGDWWLVTGILWHRHPERSRGIFTALRESACMHRGKTMSWCCLTSGDERSAIKIEGYARNDDGAKRYQNAAALHHFCAAPPFLISNFAFLIRAKLSSIISGRAVLRANLEPRTLNSTTFPLFPLYSMLYCAKMGLEIIQCMNMRVII